MKILDVLFLLLRYIALLISLSVTLFSLSQLQKLHCSPHAAQSLFFPLPFFFYCIALSLDRRFKGLLIGLNLGFVWNFWVSQWLFVGHFWVCGFSVVGSVMVVIGVYLNRWLDRWWLLLVFVCDEAVNLTSEKHDPYAQKLPTQKKKTRIPCRRHRCGAGQIPSEG